MLSKNLNDALNKQINAEAYSGYLYLAMSAWCNEKDLKGFAHWFTIQAREEFFHSSKIFDFLTSLDEKITLNAIDKPLSSWKSMRDVFDAVLAHEQKVTGMIDGLMNIAKKENEHKVEIFLQWFVNEQIEEESSAKDAISQLKLIGNDGHGLYQMDQTMGSRILGPDALAAMTGAPAA